MIVPTRISRQPGSRLEEAVQLATEEENEIRKKYTPAAPSKAKRIKFVIIATVILVIIVIAIFIMVKKKEGVEPTTEPGESETSTITAIETTTTRTRITRITRITRTTTIASMVTVANENGTSICNTGSCAEFADFLEWTTNPREDPCNDLYEYACGKTQGWRFEERMSHLGYLEKQNDLRANLSIYRNFDDSPEPVKFIRKTFSLCTNESILQKNNLSSLRSLIGEMHDERTVEDLIADAIKYDLMTFIEMKIVPSLEDPYKRVVKMSPATFNLDKTFGDADVTRSYSLFIEKALSTFPPFRNDGKEIADRITQFEIKAARNKKEKLDLSDIKTKDKSILSTIQGLDFIKIFDLVIDDPSITEIVLVDEAYFKFIPVLLKDGLYDMKHFFAWTVWLKYGWTLSSKFYNLMDAFHQMRDNKSLPHYDYAFNVIQKYTPNIFSRMFVEEVGQINEHSIDKAIEMLSFVKSAMVDQIDGLGWMEEVDKKRLKDKLGDMKHLIGYPKGTMNDEKLAEELDIDYGVDESDTGFNLLLRIQTSHWKQQLNKLKSRSPIDLDHEWPQPSYLYPINYYQKYNSLLVGTYHLNNRLYGVMPLYINYATLAFMMAYKMMDAFDPSEERLDPTGQLVNVTSWTKQSLAEYENRQKRMAEYYSALNVSGIKLNGRKTATSDMADHFALGAIYKAFKERKLDDEPKIQGHEGKSSDQMFFIAYAGMFCAYLPKYRVKQFVENPNIRTSLENIRVNVPLSLMKQFSDTFGCAAGSRMNQTGKLIPW